MVNQPYKYYCVIDFEATNEEDPFKPGHGRSDYPSEIIQFPAILIESSTNSIIGQFNRYVRPSINPLLSMHIKRLTHITQEQINNADSFIDVLKQFENWLSNYSPKPFNDVCFVTDGKFDFGDILRKELTASRIERPLYMTSCLDIKTRFKQYYRQNYYKNITQMLGYLGMSFSGSQHNGLDDSRNIARIVQVMLRSTVLEKNQFY